MHTTNSSCFQNSVLLDYVFFLDIYVIYVIVLAYWNKKISTIFTQNSVQIFLSRRCVNRPNISWFMIIFVYVSLEGCMKPFPVRLADWSSGRDEFVVRPLQAHEIVVCALLDNISSRHHSYDIRVLDSRQTVSNDDTSSAFSCFIQSLLYSLAHRRTNIDWMSSHTTNKQWKSSKTCAFWLTFSLSVSSAEVASSSRSILGSRMIALAIAMRCFWPRESWEPWEPTLVSYFCIMGGINNQAINIFVTLTRNH